MNWILFGILTVIYFYVVGAVAALLMSYVYRVREVLIWDDSHLTFSYLMAPFDYPKDLFLSANQSWYKVYRLIKWEFKDQRETTNVFKRD